MVDVSGLLELAGTSTFVAEGADRDAQVGGEWAGVGVTIQAGDAVIDAGSAISADGQGYVGLTGGPGAGPGAGGAGTDGGAAHGDTGGKGWWGQPDTIAYGDPLQPVDLGSAGTAHNGGATGSSGGGAVRLTVAGALQLDGEISADGADRSSGSAFAGAGSGGSVWVTTDVLSGTGRVTADGGSVPDGAGGGGAGGRVAVVYGDASTFSGFEASTAAGGAGRQVEPTRQDEFNARDGSVAFLHTSALTADLVVQDYVSLPDESVLYYNSVSVVGGGTLVLGGGTELHVSGAFDVTGGSTVVARSRLNFYRLDEEWEGVGVRISAGDLTVGAGSLITADGYGYVGGNSGGVGPGASGSTHCATHGGIGGNSGGPGWPSPNIYGDAFAPTELGSGGGLWDASSPADRGGAGGGAIWLDVAGTFALDGEVSADALNLDSSDQQGLGAGGSIYVVTSVLTGAGRLTAEGGSSLQGTGGGGGGGQIAVYYEDATGFGDFTASSAAGGSGLGAGEDGSVVFADTSVPYGSYSFYQHVWLPDDSVDLLGAARLFDGTVLSVGGGSTLTVYGDLDLESGATLVARGAARQEQVDGTWQGAGATINAGNLTVAAGAAITADGQGYVGGVGGPGAGPGAYSEAWPSGAAHGGTGGPGFYEGYTTPKTNYNTYGDAFQPSTLGSGGSSFASAEWWATDGGGAIRLTVGGVFTLDGEVSADGLDALGDGSAGAGSGGSVWVTTSVLTGSGRFSADGGAADTQDGGGGGGHVAVYFAGAGGFLDFDASTAAGGAGENPGGTGSVLFIDTSVPGGYVSFLSDFDLANAPTATFGGMTVRNGATLFIPGGAILNLPGDVVVTENSRIVAGATNRMGSIGGQWIGRGVSISAANIRVDAGSEITADAQGYTGGSQDSAAGGPGAGPQDSGAGGTHAGVGGVGQWESAANPNVYGDAYSPTDLGSGGAAASWSSFQGGAGGGAIRLEASGTVTVDGTISADGEDVPEYYSVGAGAGGSVFILAHALDGSGRVSADGGQADPMEAVGGAGGGGRVVVAVAEVAGSGSMTVDGGSGGYGGGEGGQVTLYVPDAGVPVGWTLTAFGGANVDASETAAAGVATVSDAPELWWTAPADDAFHGVETLRWAAPGFAGQSVTADLVLEPSGIVIATGLSASGMLDWDTTGVSDGVHELRVVFRDEGGGVVGEIVRIVLVNNAAVWHAGTVEADELWGAGAVHVVEGQLHIAAGATVTLEAGAVVKFLPQAGLTVEDGGILEALGSEGAPIILTALADDAAGGDTNYDAAGSAPLPGAWEGIQLEGSGAFNHNGQVELRYIRVVHMGSVDADETWLGGITHIVGGELLVGAGVTLTVQPGAVVKFEAAASVRLLAGAHLTADGTPAQPIYFTSVRDDTVGGDSNHDALLTAPAAGDWRGIIAAGGTATLDHAIISYAGGTASGSADGEAAALVAHSNGDIEVTNSVIRDAFFEGVITGFGAPGTVDLTNCLILRADRAANVDACTVRLLNCTLDDNRIGVWGHGGDVEVVNTIISNSIQAGIDDVGGGAGSITVRYSDVWSATGDNYAHLIEDQTGLNGNISSAPDFANPALEDYRLSYLSPAIDAADGAAAPVADLMGAARYDDPRMPNTGIPAAGGAYADMGAHEFVEAAESDIDLMVSAVWGPTEALAGQTVTIQWIVTNVGTGEAIGPWEDAISLDFYGARTEAAERNVGQGLVLGPGQSASFSADVRVPAAADSGYRWRVDTNVWGDVYEGPQADNNAGVSLGTVDVSLLALPADGAPVGGAFAEPGLPCWFRVEGAEGDVLITLDTAAGGAASLYVARGYVPTPELWDFAATGETGADLQVLARDDEGLGLFVMVSAQSLPAQPLAFTVCAAPADLGLDSVAQTVVAASGTATLELHGGALTPELTYELVGPGDQVYAAESVLVAAPGQAFARFVLDGAPLGLYDVRVRSAGETAALQDAVQVVAPVAVENLRDSLSISVDMPDLARAGRQVEIGISYTNIGLSDMSLPLLTVAAPEGGELRFLKDSVEGDSTITLLGPGSAPGLTRLGPGETGTVSLWYTVPIGIGTVTFDVYADLFDDQAFAGQAIDWDRVSANLRPDGVTDPAWDAYINGERARYGETYGDLYAYLENQIESVFYATGDEMVYVDGRWLGGKNLTVTPPKPTSPAIDNTSVPGQAVSFPTLHYTQPVLHAPGVPTAPQADGVHEVSAVLIGAGQYPTGHNLWGAVNDSYGWYNLLSGTYNIPSSSINLLADTPDSSADNFSAYDVTAAIADAIHNADADDLIIIMDSGHGALGTDGHGYAMYNGSYLSGADFNAALQNAPCTVLFIADTCFAGAITAEINNPNVITAASSTGTQVSYNSGAAYQGFFSSNVLQQISQSPDGNLLTAISNAGQSTAAAVASHQNATQTPVLNPGGFTNVTMGLDTKTDATDQMQIAQIQSPPVSVLELDVGMSWDPNDKVGSAGVGPEQFVAPGPLEYTIHFENDPVLATLPAQEVLVSDQLDPALDWSSLELVSIGFNDVYVALPEGLQQYTGRFFVGTDPNPVDVSVSFDAETGLLQWTMQSVDPVTRALPKDPLAGFLPPNDATGRGEGQVSFRIRPQAGVVTGDVVVNQAGITFEANAPIVTNEVLRTIDAGLPASQVSPLAAEQSGADFAVAWSGADDAGGAGIVSWDIYVSDNGAPFGQWLAGVESDSQVFTGEQGHSYAFYSVATDAVGHREAAPAAPDAVTAVAAAENTPPTVGSLADSPHPVTRPGSLTLTAEDVSDADGTVQAVAFYRDADANGTFEVGADLLLGTDTDGADGWSWQGSAAGWPSGEVACFARAQDNDAAWGEPGTALASVLNAAPSVLSLGISASAQSLALTAAGVSDPDGSIGRIAFYSDANHDGLLQADTDTWLGDGTQSGGNWALGPVDVSAWESGQYTFFAVAQDNEGAWSDVVSAQASVGYRYVGTIAGPAGVTVSVYDCDDTADVSLSNIAVKFGKTNTVSTITLGGTQPMGGLGLAISGASSAGSIKDSRKGSLGSLAFIASNAPIKSIQLKSGMSGYNLNGLTLGGLSMPADIDSDGNLADLTAIYSKGAASTVSIAGKVAGDIWVGGAMGSLSITSGSLSADLTAMGNVGKISLGGDFGSSMHILGSLSSMQLSGGDFKGSLDVTGNISKLSILSLTNKKTCSTVGGTFRAGADVTVGGVPSSLSVSKHDTANGGEEFGLYSHTFGKITLGALRLTASSLPYKDGDFCVELA